MHLISLYNALNGTDYGEDEAVEITTLDDAIYMGSSSKFSIRISLYPLSNSLHGSLLQTLDTRSNHLVFVHTRYILFFLF